MAVEIKSISRFLILRRRTRDFKFALLELKDIYIVRLQRVRNLLILFISAAIKYFRAV